MSPPPDGLLRPLDRGGATGVGYSPIEKEKKRLHNLLNAVTLQRSGSVCGASVIGAYHARGVAPLMARTLSLYEMTPDAPLEGSMLA
jgi:hypothetical protein